MNHSLEQVAKDDELFEWFAWILIDIGRKGERPQPKETNRHHLCDQDHPMVGLHEWLPVDVPESLKIQQDDEQQKNSDEGSHISLNSHEESFTDVKRHSS